MSENRITAIEAIKLAKNKDYHILKREKWLMLLALTSERNVNFERLYSMEELSENYVLGYVEKTLEILENFNLEENEKYIIEEVLKWSEVSKSGLTYKRTEWINRGYNLFVHNIGSAQIYEAQSEEKDPKNKRIIKDLILTHGLIGQYIRGEVNLVQNKPLYTLVEENFLTQDNLKEILHILNCCIISAVDERLWIRIESQVGAAIASIAEGRFEQLSTRERVKRLRHISINQGENFDLEYDKIFSDHSIKNNIEELFETTELWFIEAALYDFTLEEFTKILLLAHLGIRPRKVKHLNFEKLMRGIYYQHKGKKKINLYKKRIIEKYLSDLYFEAIKKEVHRPNHHVVHEMNYQSKLDDTLFFDFKFSDAAGKLIEFCVEAEKSDVLYESAIVILFDLFDLRKDKFDRFHEEETYLNTMNKSIDYKKIILQYITGDRIMDIGPGGGALMDLIEDQFPEKRVMGVDFSKNVLESLNKKKNLENRKWGAVYGDALYLNQYFPKGDVDTIIFCSVLHELFSYIEFEGKKFNKETLKSVLNNALEILPKGGRIIIRDGIMTEPKEQNRIIRFFSQEGMEFLKGYVMDFKGREINYKIIGKNEVLMPVNDAMEFIYTYTWGEASYIHEVNEQFGYFTPSEFLAFIASELNDSIKIIEFKHYLQEGYTIALSQKIDFLMKIETQSDFRIAPVLLLLKKSEECKGGLYMFGVRFIKFQPSEYVFRYKNGKITKEGAGISFYYYAPHTSIAAVPLGSMDVPFIFEEVTSDFQTVTLQGQMTYRIIDQKKIVNLLNYTLDMKGKGYISEDAKKLPQRVINIVRVLTKKTIEGLQLKDAIISSELVAQSIFNDIKLNEEINLLGIEILGLSILAILPNKETARALEAQTREQILKKADEAIYERRNASINQERKVKENEFNTEIAVENKRREVKETQLEAEKVVQIKQNELKEEQLAFETGLEEKKKSFIELVVENSKAEADAKAYELSAVMKALEGIEPNVIQSLASIGMEPNQLIAIAFQEIATRADKIGQLNISPDLLQELSRGR